MPKVLPDLGCPLITILDTKHHLRDIPVAGKVRLYLDGINLMAYKVLLCGSANEVVLYWESTNPQPANNKGSTIKGRDAAFIGPVKVNLQFLMKTRLEWLCIFCQEELQKKLVKRTYYLKKTILLKQMVPLFGSYAKSLFVAESTLMFASNGSHIGFAKMVQGYRLSTSDDHAIELSLIEKHFRVPIPQQVHWQETLRGYVAGILTTHRVLMVSADLDILASSSAKFDKGLPSIS
ncbi:hypothetical protein POTOM_026967 [Populus tomentosa]|uniref:Uncharacterized protein n=1 Tax=Populus tomentosa TaxID=118781 RepID=A0A8X7ZRS5_POPTO|nr:hypothetical protein POTOM_026967 [Populus tomentosa]